MSVLFLALSVVPALGASAARTGSRGESIPIEKLIERHANKGGKFYQCRISDDCNHAKWHQRAARNFRPR